MSKVRTNIIYVTVLLSGIAAGCLVALIYNTASIFFPYVMQGLNLASVAEISLYMTITAFSAALVMPLWGRLVDRISLRILGTISVCMVASAYFLMSVATSVVFFYVAGVIIGSFMAFITYLFIPTMINRWVKTRVGLFEGICYASASFGAVIFNQVGGFLLSEYGWQFTYRAFGVIALVMFIPFMVIIRDFPQDYGVLPFGAREKISSAEKLAESEKRRLGAGIPSNIATKCLPFYLTLGCAGCLGIIAGIYQLLPTYATTISVHAATIGPALASVAMIGSTIGKLTIGFLNDISVKFALVVCASTGGIGMLLMWLMPEYEIALMAGGFLYGFLFAGTTVQTPLIVRKVFGLKDYSRIYSKVALVRSLLAGVGVTFWSLSVSAGGYSLMFIGGVAMAVLIVGLGWLAIVKGEALLKQIEEQKGTGCNSDHTLQA